MNPSMDPREMVAVLKEIERLQKSLGRQPVQVATAFARAPHAAPQAAPHMALAMPCAGKRAPHPKMTPIGFNTGERSAQMRSAHSGQGFSPSEDPVFQQDLHGQDYGQPGPEYTIRRSWVTQY